MTEWKWGEPYSKSEEFELENGGSITLVKTYIDHCLIEADKTHVDCTNMVAIRVVGNIPDDLLTTLVEASKRMFTGIRIEVDRGDGIIKCN